MTARPVPQPGVGGADALPHPVDVAVVGGGLAGVAAAVVLGERGARVTLLEREPVLGGRLAGWPDRLATGEEFAMERGFHAFFRQYFNLRALLRRADPGLHSLQPVGDYALLGPDGAAESFTGLPARPPFNALALMWRSPTVGLRDLRTMDGAEAREMMRFDPRATYERLDGQSATEYLDRLRMPPAARRMLFEVFARSFFDPDDEMSAAELLMRFHLYFMGSSEGLLFDVVTEPFADAVWRPLGRYLAGLGVDVRLGRAVASIEPPAGDAPGEGRWRVHSEDPADTVDADAVVLALTVGGLQAVVDASPGVGGPVWREAVAELRGARPFAVWRLWLDRPVDASRPVFAGTAGMGLLDNVSLLHRYQGESRRWALRTGGSVVELHAYALPPGRAAGDETTQASVKADLRARLSALYPETAAAGVVEERWLLRADAPAFPPGSHAGRPGVETGVPGLALAGDMVRLDFPSALMERAVASGMLAANSVLRRWGVAPEPVWSVPTRGLLAWVRSGRCP